MLAYFTQNMEVFLMNIQNYFRNYFRIILGVVAFCWYAGPASPMNDQVNPEFGAQLVLDTMMGNKTKLEEWFEAMRSKNISFDINGLFILNNEQGTLLYFACLANQIRVAKFLLDKGADINFPNQGNLTPLYAACSNGHLACVEWLVKMGGNLQVISNNNKNTLLHAACINGNIELVEYLLKTGKFNIEVTDSLQRTPLHIACQFNNVDCIKFLLNNGACITAKTKDNNTPLHFCCYHGFYDGVKALFEQNNNIIHAINTSQETPLHVACFSKNHAGAIKCVELLWQFGAEIEAVDYEQKTPLHLACSSSSIPCIEFLLDKGANIFVKDSKGNTPLHICCYEGFFEGVKDLVIKNSDTIKEVSLVKNTPLHLACTSKNRNGAFECIKFLLEYGIDVCALDDQGVTALHQLSYFGRLKEMMILLDYIENNQINYDINIQDNEHGFTPLHSSCMEGHIECVMLLIKNGAHLDIKDKNGRTPITLAREKSFISLANFLEAQEKPTAYVEDICSICQDNIQDDDLCFLLSCGHMFHATCLTPVEDILCPLDRKETNVEDEDSSKGRKLVLFKKQIEQKKNLKRKRDKKDDDEKEESKKRKQTNDTNQNNQ